jgi:hypothetical protein
MLHFQMVKKKHIFFKKKMLFKKIQYYVLHNTL